MSKSGAAKKKIEIPEYLIYERLDGKPIYYKGYKAVLDNTKTLEEIMGSSSLQAEIIMYLLDFFLKNIGIKDYRIYTNEVGGHLKRGSNMSFDIAVYDKQLLTSKKIGKKYVNVPPMIVIEVDLDADLHNIKEHEYIHKKTQKLLDFGTRKVIWITTQTQKVTVATPNENWQIIDWNKDIELMNNFSFNIGKYLAEEGIDPNAE